ncbi:hypothetical protein CHLRE_07g343650v5 [Chlamydomonas reinhardtii]|uniref:phytol kinase n=1 Tax=Chlamydomonas reinhardtii TaxID=3055 RepID=A0A2K3DKT8_CHLRE|nr:uncharacterized protein CHLRE_07g343650v5 [Chlamydomonas reinhardtii]PNW81128.1 hypothetical protein CHLRE_07g343650v5 [Chlamydomonas reinhardtii]
MPPRRARVPATLESRIKQGLQYFADLREDTAADVARAEDLEDALLEADVNIISNTGILSGIVAAHGWAARALAVDVLNDSAYVAFVATATKLRELLSSQPGDPVCDRQDRLVRALLRADTLAVYARLCVRTLAPTRGAAARRSLRTPDAVKRDLVWRVLKSLSTIARFVDNSLRQELLTALAHTQLLEHAARALLHAAQSIQPASSAGTSGAAAASGTGLSAESWTTLSAAATIFAHLLPCLVGTDLAIAALCPRPRASVEASQNLRQLQLLEQLRPLLAGRCVQLCAGWAGLCAALTLQQQGAADGSAPQSLLPTASQLWHGLPSELMRLLQLPPQATVSRPDMVRAATVVCVFVMQVTVSGPCDLAIAQPPVGYDRLPHRQPQPQRSSARPSAGSAAAEGPAAAPAPASYSAVNAYRLLRELWCGLACDSGRCRPTMFMVAKVMARLLTELRPRQAAVLLPSWWQLLAQEPSMLFQECRLAQDAGELLRLQLNAPPPAAWAAGVTDAASVAAASVDWPPEPAEVKNTEAAIAANAAASLARERDPSYSLRCALDAGLLSVMERCLRAPQAWRQSDSVSKLLYVVNCVLRYSGVWPAVLARGPLQQAVSLIATLGAAARLLQEKDTSLDVISRASQPGMQTTARCGAGGYLCAYLSAMLEQVVDVRALREGAQQQQQQQQQQQREKQQAAAIDATAAGPIPLHLNSVLEKAVDSKDGSVKPSTFSIAWMAAAGGLPAAGSTAYRQQQLLTSFALYQWLPMLAKATEDALCSEAGAERWLSQALLVGHLVMDVLWREERPPAEADEGAGSRNRRQDAAWWEGVTQTGQLAKSMHNIVYLLATDAEGVVLEHCEQWQQAAVLDLLQSYWTRFAEMARVTIRARATRAAEQQQLRQQQADGKQQAGQAADGGAGSSTSSLGDTAAQQQQAPPPELVLQCLTPLPVQQLAVAHGRQGIVDYLDAVTAGLREELLIECGGAGAGGSGMGVQGPANREGGASAKVDRLSAKWHGAVRPRYPWLLSECQVQAGLHDLMVAEAAAAAAATATGEPAAACGGGSSRSKSRSGQGSSSDGPVFEHKLCYNPRCCSLDGPSALVAPRGGKTCVRCRAATYCCGACQLVDWRERHSGTCSGAAAATAGSAGTAKAALKEA